MSLFAINLDSYAYQSMITGTQQPKETKTKIQEGQNFLHGTNTYATTSNEEIGIDNFESSYFDTVEFPEVDFNDIHSVIEYYAKRINAFSTAPLNIAGPSATPVLEFEKNRQDLLKQDKVFQKCKQIIEAGLSAEDNTYLELCMKIEEKKEKERFDKSNTLDGSPIIY